MGYAFLWIELLFASLFWLAIVLARPARKQQWFWLNSFGKWFLPFGSLFMDAAGAAAWLRIVPGIQNPWLGYFSSLLGAYLVLGIAITIVAARTNDDYQRRRAANWSRARLSAAFVLTATVIGLTLWRMDVAARAQGENLRDEAQKIMLSMAPAYISNANNAAAFYEKAFAIIDADKSLGTDSLLDSIDPDFNSPEAVALLKRHEMTLQWLRRGAQLKQCRFAHDYAHPTLSTQLPEYKRLRKAAQILALAAHSEASHGEVSSAVSDVNAIFQLSKAAGNDPNLIGCLVAMGCDSLGSKCLADVLPSVTRQEELSTLHIGDPGTLSLLMVRAFQGEEARGFYVFSDMYEGRVAAPTPLPTISADPSMPMSPAVFSPPVAVLQRIFLLPNDVADYRKMMAYYEALVALPFPRTLPAKDPMTNGPHRGFVAGILTPTLFGNLGSQTRSCAEHSCATLVIAMMRYRLEHGEYPLGQQQLVPAYLDHVLLDPYDGKPLRLVQKNDRWIIYSIGPDLIDDGGAPYDQWTKRGDLTFVLKGRKRADAQPATRDVGR